MYLEFFFQAALKKIAKEIISFPHCVNLSHYKGNYYINAVAVNPRQESPRVYCVV